MFNYVRGNPDNLTGGTTAAMGDIQGPFYDIRDYLNTGVQADLVGVVLFIGEVRWIAVPSPPALWLPADGSVLSRATYSTLFAAIGTAYGAGDGTNTFGVPEVAGRTVVGAGQGAGLTNRLLAEKGGSEPSNMPSHQHGFVGHSRVAQALVAGIYAEGANALPPYSGGPAINYRAIAPEGGGGDNMPPFVTIPAYIYAGQ